MAAAHRPQINNVFPAGSGERKAVSIYGQGCPRSTRERYLSFSCEGVRFTSDGSWTDMSADDDPIVGWNVMTTIPPSAPTDVEYAVQARCDDGPWIDVGTIIVPSW